MTQANISVYRFSAMNHYEILGVPQTASQAKIKSAYRSLVKRFHPDINPDPRATGQILRINEAYEILSDQTTRNLYDLFLQGVPVKTVIDDSNKEQKSRASFVKDKIKMQQEAMMYQVQLKQQFYRYYRLLNLVFFLTALVLTYDYYYSAYEYPYVVKDIVLGREATYVTLPYGRRIPTDRSFYNEYKNARVKDVIIKYSAVLDVPQKIRATSGTREYFIHNTIYVFRNVFSIIIFTFSLVVIGNKRYTDFRLSCGLIAGMCFIYIVLLLGSTI
ncbi:DnaJ domain-containing protein [Ekhidna lutea]|uniref:DnaJ domain-containing protein n=1 Tax=Ekhidna lutea TaxID=447679 RepID=A0A239KEW8_EKHLU|nr:J domain-containing protein [Ekhidna lutea]SNT16169.1 DnaJ domain-containing protein [Ekhidna lutea]